MKVDRWACLLTCLAVLALTAFVMAGCEYEDDSDEESTTDLDPYEPVDDDDAADDDASDDDATDDDTTDDDDAVDDDDTVDDDDVVDDDDAAPSPVSLSVVPSGNAVPVNGTQQFHALVLYSDDTEQVDPEGVTWDVADDGTASVNDGLVTGLVEGATELVASIDDGEKALVSDTVDLVIGPDVFFMDMMSSFNAWDRAAASYVADPFSFSTFVIVPNSVIIDGSDVFLVDSGDYGAGISGYEQVIYIDLVAGTKTPISLALDDDPETSLDSPWGATVYDGYLWVTGNLNDKLAKVNLNDFDDTTFIDLPDGCVPGYLDGANGKIYVGCTGFSITKGYVAGKLAVVKVSDSSISTIDLTEINPGKVLASADESTVYVVRVGDTFGEPVVAGSVIRIETDGDTIENTVDFSDALGGACLDEQGQLWVLSGISNEGYVLDTFDNEAWLVDESNPLSIGQSGAWLADIFCHDSAGLVYVADIDYTNFDFLVLPFAMDDYSAQTAWDLGPVFGTPQGIVAW